ncbi:2Fe-2S iron-sulfur cluster-binding protein [Streptomyces flavidovirens]|uniref:2Fe-2S iron-sulfur cluster-binding protein n=1 Tax=Streptomyces flavidovirens TaxID=67298 RepID=A0ABW6RBY4_9ACTN
MSENENHGTPNPGGWQPTPQGGEYDAEATAFVHLPEGMTDFGAYGDPLAAPGHDYVPPQGEMRWPEPQSAQPHDAGATGQWNFETAPEPTPPVASELTGQWTIPVADGDLPDESGEFTTSALASHWGTAPATLPGGAAAPWANTSEASQTLPGGAPAPWAAQPPAQGTHAPEHGGTPAPHAYEPAQSPGLIEDFEPEPPATAQPPAQDAPTPAQQPTPPEGNTPASSPSAPAQQPTVPGGDVPGRSPQGVERNPRERTNEAPEGSTPEETPRRGTDPEATASAVTSTDPAPEGPATPAEAPAEPAPPADAPEDPAHSEHPHASYVLRVNGADRPVTDAWIGESLLYVLRERLGLAGAKDGCSQGECGACAVQVDGRLVASCLVPAATTAGSEVRTVEGLATDGEPSDVQRALANCGAVQCGFCVPGMAMTVHDLLEGNHAPSELETRQALCGNLCRCSGYRGVLDAVREVVAEREATAAAEEARIPHQAPPGAGSVQQPHPHEHPHENPHDGGMA